MTDKTEKLKELERWVRQGEITQGLIDKVNIMSERLDIVVERVDRVVRRVNELKDKERDDLSQNEYTEMELSSALYRTRQEGSGVSIERIAEIIAKKFDGSEVSLLIEQLEQL